MAVITMLVALPIVAPAFADQTDALSVTDTVVGQGNKGPYSLSWTQIDSTTVSATLYGRALRNGTDYNIDCANGAISFNSVLLTDAVVFVSYKKTAGKSKSTSTDTSQPVAVSLMTGQSANIKLMGLYKQNNDDSDDSDTGKAVIGVGGEKKWSSSTFESMFLMSQATDSSSSSEQGSAWDRSAFKLGNTMDVGSLNLTGSYSHAGTDFLGSDEYSMAAGQRAMDFAGVYNGGKSLRATFKFQDTQQTDDDDDDTTYSRVNKQEVAFTPSGATKISMAHSVTETGYVDSDNSDTTVESSHVQVNQNLGAKTSAVVSVKDVTTTDDDSTDQVQTTQASLTSSVLPGVNVKGALTRTDSLEDGVEQKITTALSVTPASRVSVKAEFSQDDADDAKNVTKGAALELLPLDCAKLAAGLKYVDSGASMMTVRDYSASAKPWKFFTFSGSLRDRELRQDFIRDTRKLNVALSPISRVKLTGDYQENPEDSNGDVQTYKATTLGMNLQLGSVGVTTNFTSKDEYLSSTLSDERQIGLEMPAFGRGKLSTGYKIARTLDGSDYSENTYSLGYKHSIGSDFSLALTGYYTYYMQDQALLPENTEYKSELSLGLKF